MKADQEWREHERLLELQTAVDRVLIDVGIECTNTPFMDFVTEKWKSKRKHVDLVISSMLIDWVEETSRKISTFCQIVLNQGSYCFVIVTETQFTNLYDILKEKDFKILDRFLRYSTTST